MKRSNALNFHTCPILYYLPSPGSQFSSQFLAVTHRIACHIDDKPGCSVTMSLHGAKMVLHMASAPKCSTPELT